MAVGRDEIRDIALAQEMGGLDGWTYPYQEILIDEKKGQVIGLWKQIADAKRADGTPYEVRASAAAGSATAATSSGRGSATSSTSATPPRLFMEMMKDGTLSDGMTARMERSATGDLPGPLPAR